jgi:UDP-N-acetylmuramate dehydrogenase
MEFKKDFNIKAYNTFGLSISAKYFAPFHSVSELQNLLSKVPTDTKMILGGGSNILFTKDFDGTILQNQIKGIQKVREDNQFVYLEVGGGEVWHDFVLYCIEKNWGGVENLSLIPGSVGASPMQNIGAYGVEIKDVFEELKALEIETGEIHHFSHEACKFGYRESVFKRELKDKYIILSVTYRLSKNPEVNTQYGAINDELNAMEVQIPTIKNVSDAVIAIRQSKLPNPAEIGNAGSFFKNPVVSNDIVDQIKIDYPNIPVYPIDEASSKIPAGWLIEQAGWKGKKRENYGVHAKQALVLVNYGGAKGSEIIDLSSEIIQSILTRFGVELEREVNVV